MSTTETVAFDELLQGAPWETLVDRFDGELMNESEIYPSRWTEPSEHEDLAAAYTSLRDFVHSTHQLDQRSGSRAQLTHPRALRILRGDIMRNNHDTQLLFDLSKPGRRALRMPALDVPERAASELLPPSVLAERAPALPELAEPQVVRHFTNLSTQNMSVDTHFYPLGSCTMKHNPKRNERAAALPGFADLHPYQPEASHSRGCSRSCTRCRTYLSEISGLPACSLQPAAGAHGELTALWVAAAYFRDTEHTHRTKVLVPDSAHGTNPASAIMAGFEVVTVKTLVSGEVDMDDFRAKLDDQIAVFMITNPNTVGVYEPRIGEITDEVHARGGLVYLDGANMNAILGISRPGDFGADMQHYNPHKTFSGPHGGGGPGAGPICVAEKLRPYLPAPTVVREGDRYRLEFDAPKSIGRVRSFFGNVGVLVRAYCYIRTHGPDGLRRVSEHAVLNANYLLSRVKHFLPVAAGRPLHARVRRVGQAAQERQGRHRDGHRQAASRLRHARPDGLLPADRARSPDVRADRDREQGDPRPLRGDALPDHRRVARAAPRGAPHDGDQPARRSRRGAEADALPLWLSETHAKARRRQGRAVVPDDPDLWKRLRVGDLVRVKQFPKFEGYLDDDTRAVYRWLVDTGYTLTVERLETTKGIDYPWSAGFTPQQANTEDGEHWLMLDHDGLEPAT